jgi:hypothetical protein
MVKHAKMKAIYHYTTADRFMQILEAEEITPATARVMPPEIPAVWLSTAPVWEGTATKGIIEDGIQRSATLAEMIQSCGSLVRIEIDPRQVRAIPPLKLRESLRIPKSTFDGLTRAAQSMGANPMEWRAVAGPIPASAWLRVQVTKEHAPLCWIELSQDGTD